MNRKLVRSPVACLGRSLGGVMADKVVQRSLIESALGGDVRPTAVGISYVSELHPGDHGVEISLAARPPIPENPREIPCNPVIRPNYAPVSPYCYASTAVSFRNSLNSELPFPRPDRLARNRPRTGKEFFPRFKRKISKFGGVRQSRDIPDLENRS